MRPVPLFLTCAILAMLSSAPAALSYSQAPSPVGYEQLVEGHTVFHAMTVPSERLVGLFSSTTSEARQEEDPADAAASGAPSVFRERSPGVRWTNDQFLVGPYHQEARFSNPAGPEEAYSVSFATALMVRVDVHEGATQAKRTPCGGALIVVNAGERDPRPPIPPIGRDPVAYLESYLITDPNGNVWVTDAYADEGAPPVPTMWVVNLGGGLSFVPDAGLSCETKVDSPSAGHRDPGLNGACFHADPHGSGCPVANPRTYNALLYLGTGGLFVDHTPQPHDDPFNPTQTTACEAGTAWVCLYDDDNQEGNSHPFGPANAFTMGVCPPEWQTPGGSQANHGGSTTAAPQTAFPGSPSASAIGTCDNIHRTYVVDIYHSAYSRPAEPAQRRFAMIDTEGSDAAFGPSMA